MSKIKRAHPLFDEEPEYRPHSKTTKSLHFAGIFYGGVCLVASIYFLLLVL